jgi:hypothetical protein
MQNVTHKPNDISHGEMYAPNSSQDGLQTLHNRCAGHEARAYMHFYHSSSMRMRCVADSSWRAAKRHVICIDVDHTHHSLSRGGREMLCEQRSRPDPVIEVCKTAECNVSERAELHQST